MVVRDADPLALATASVSRADRCGLAYVALTAPQRAYVSSSAPEAAWVDGNQLGKSYAQAFDILHRARGTHPYATTKRPPVNIVVISVSFEQIVPLMEKIWLLVPKNEIDPENGFEPGRGITGKPPRIVFVSGPGRGSVITFATYSQGSTRIAGLTADAIYLDEPPTESMYGEIKPRLMRRRGVLRITMTPTPDMPDQAWYRKKVEKGEVEYFNFGLTAANLRPEGYPTPWLYQWEIDAYEAELLDYEREMRMRGAWEPVVTDRVLQAFSAHRHAREFSIRDLRGKWELGVGMDHGTADGKQCAVLLATKGRTTARPRAAFLNERVAEGFTTPEHDAEAVLDMLGESLLCRRDLRKAYGFVDFWVGDVPTGSHRLDVSKSNREIRREIARLLDVPMQATKHIDLPKKTRGSGAAGGYGYRLLNTLYSRFDEDGTPHATIHASRCQTLIDAHAQFNGDRRHVLKDVLDGGRYIAEKMITGRVLSTLSSRY